MSVFSAQKMSLSFEAYFNEKITQVAQLRQQGKAIPLTAKLSLFPLGLLVATENAIKLPILALSTLTWEAPTFILQISARVLLGKNYSTPIREARQSLPGLVSFSYTAYKVLGLFIGSFFSVTWGLYRPDHNHAVHNKLYLLDPSPSKPLSAEDFKRLKKANEELNTQLADSKRDEAKSIEGAYQLTSTNQWLTLQLETFRQREATSNAEVAQLRTANEALTQQIAALTKEPTELALTQQLNASRNNSASFQEELAQLGRDNQALSDRLDAAAKEAEADAEGSQRVIDDAVKEEMKAKGRCEEWIRKYGDAKKAIDKLTAEANKSTAYIFGLEKQLAEKEAYIKELEVASESVNSSVTSEPGAPRVSFDNKTKAQVGVSSTEAGLTRAETSKARARAALAAKAEAKLKDGKPTSPVLPAAVAPPEPPK